jgi:hypothetical protein
MFLMDALRDAVPDIVDAKHNYFPPVEINGERHGDHIWLSDLYDSLNDQSEKFKKFNFSENTLSDLNKFAVVRNPYSRTLSLFSFFRRFNNEVYTPKMFENDVLNIEDRFDSYHLFQTDFLCERGSDKLLIDKLFKVDNDILANVGQYIGAELKATVRVNVTSTRKIPDEEFFSNTVVCDKIFEFFNKDFRVLGYLKDNFNN